MAAIGLLGFCKNILTLDTVRGLVTVSGPNFVSIGQTIAQIWRLVDFSKWRLLANLDLFCDHLDQPVRVFDSSFDNMQVFVF